MKPVCLLPVLLLLAPFASAQVPPEAIKAQRAKLLDGVRSIPKPGAPGPVAVWGTLAFPILAAPGKDGADMAVAAAAAFGKGRLVLFGHNQFLDGSAGGDHPKFLENCVKWVANKDKPRLLIKGVRGESFYRDRGFRAETLSGPITAKDLRGSDVLVVNMQGVIDPAEGAVVAEFIKSGGGFIGGMTGWAFGQTSGGKQLATAHGLNLALLPAGLAITDQSGFESTREFSARLDLSPYINASNAIAAMKQQTSGGTATPEDRKQMAASVQIAMGAQPPDRNTLQEAVMGALGKADGKEPVPSVKTPLTEAAHSADRIRLGNTTKMLGLAAGVATAHPAAAEFPGKVPAEARRVTQSVRIHPAVPGWASTGLYAAAGDAIVVTLPAGKAGQGYSVRIGCHTDKLYHLDKWMRAPEISKTVSLASPETRTGSAFGGLIYIDVPAKVQDNAEFEVTVAGAVEAPLFVLGRDNDSTWNSALKRRPAPWAEFACDKVILSCPSEVARTVNNPTELMQFWAKVVDAEDEISNQTAERRRPERIVADVQISAGYMHSGYPIMVPVSAAPEMVTYSSTAFPGWGFYHELGHNHQRGDFNFEGTTEVTNNVIGMYVYEAVLKKDWLSGHPQISAEGRKANLKKLLSASDKWSTWRDNPFIALTTYIELVQAFGFDAWRQYLGSFSDGAFGPKPGTDDQKRDQFLIRYSKIVKKNLGPFFDRCGIPVSDAAKAEVSNLEAWMPKGI